MYLPVCTLEAVLHRLFLNPYNHYNSCILVMCTLLQFQQDTSWSYACCAPGLIGLKLPPCRGLKGIVFESGSRNGFIHLFGIIKWMNFIQKWDFHLEKWDIYYEKAHIFDIWYEIGEFNSPKYWLKMPCVRLIFNEIS